MQIKSLRAVCPKRRRFSGFTLVELMIVIAIIAVLVVLTVGMSRKMIQKAQRVNAVSALRQIAVATSTYTAENNGELNRVIDGGEGKLVKGATWVADTFWGRLSGYMFSGLKYNTQQELATEIRAQLPAYFNTKDFTTMRGTPLSGSKIYADTSGIKLPLGFNSKIYKWNELKKVHSFDDPARVVYFTYGFYHFNSTDAQASAVTVPIKDPATQSNIYWFEDRTAPFTFLDGHVEVLRPPLSDERFE